MCDSSAQKKFMELHQIRSTLKTKTWMNLLLIAEFSSSWIWLLLVFQAKRTEKYCSFLLRKKQVYLVRSSRHESNSNDRPVTRKIEIILEYSKKRKLKRNGKLCKYETKNWTSLIMQKFSTVFFLWKKKKKAVRYIIWFQQTFWTKGAVGYICPHSGRNTSVHSSQFKRKH